MPHKYPPEFKRDVVAVARRGDASQEQIATDFGISTSTLKRWTAQADIDDGVVQRVTSDEQAELAALRRRTRLLEQENEDPASSGRVLRQGLAPKMMFPLYPVTVSRFRGAAEVEGQSRVRTLGRGRPGRGPRRRP
jgi:transposase-like protein